MRRIDDACKFGGARWVRIRPVSAVSFEPALGTPQDVARWQIEDPTTHDAQDHRGCRTFGPPFDIGKRWRGVLPDRGSGGIGPFHWISARLRCRLAL